MNIYLDCIPCFLRQALDAVRRITDDARLHEQIVREVLRLAADLDLNRPPPWVAQSIHRRLHELTGVDDPYRQEKDRFNRLAAAMLPELRTTVRQAPRSLTAAAQMAIAANVIDLGVKSALGVDQASEALRNACAVDAHGDFAELQRQANQARAILYLADNAGEIVIDRLLIEELGPERVTLVVRGKPVINDATIEDARAAGLCELVTVIDNGSDAPGTILDDCSAEFRERFRKADLIVAKGQGNFETLSGVDANLFFLFKVKCPVIAHHTGLPLGLHVLLDKNSACAQREEDADKPAWAAV
ncbi:MAG: DUF89 family protein [Deltaproteobacteria bacterium]|nr:DUF89 family protein [Deltaproteobacteria bacterium]